MGYTPPDNPEAYRFVVDYRKLNAITKYPRYPLPLIDDLILNIPHTDIMAALDLRSVYFQMVVNPSDIVKTAFVTKNGTYAFRRMPFGLSEAAPNFQKAIDIILKPVIGKFVNVYMDDVIISSPSFPQHVKHFKEVFRLLHEAGLTINKDKCKFGCEELKYLGFIINTEGIKTDETKVQAIVEMKPPRNSKEVSKFLGMSQWYAKFIKNYADICEPLNNLKRKLNKFICLIEAQKAFDAVKAVITKAPVLKLPDFKKHFELFTDASSMWVGAVLNQEQRPVVFASRTLSAADRNYTVTERECLAVVWALNKFRTYLGSLPIKVITDHTHAVLTHLTTVTLDLLGPYPVSRVRRNRYVLEITDHFSKWAEIIPLKKASARVIADNFLDNYISRFGAPIKLISDNGPQFISDIFENLSERLGIRYVKTVVYRPQGNRTECVNHDLVQMIANCVNEQHDTRDQFLREFAYAIRTAVNETTGNTPAKLFLVGDIERLFEEARRNTKTKHEKWEKYYNRRRRKVQIKVNDWVLVATHPLNSATRKVVAKFKPKFEGPYRILDVKNNNVVIWKAGKMLTINVDQVRIYRHRKCDETEIGTGSSDNGNLRDESSGLTEYNGDQMTREMVKRKGEKSIPSSWSEKGRMIKKSKNERLGYKRSNESRSGGPVRSRKGTERNDSPYIEERTRSSNKNDRRGGDQQ
ncbi:retrovirus-related Pol polyprotein from transposon 297 [Trichonephila clavipes]|nr:retrovirus-related Pol polyprotein from transposon 297 [Trichonephila clavipes]